MMKIGKFLDEGYIEMEKLIELLNEWELEVGSSKLKWYIGNNPIGIYCKSYEYHFGWASKIILISKEYGFIKWLVENDKIDTNKYENILDRIEYYSQSEEEKERHYYSDYESLLMLLAISNEPIDFLIEILK